MYIGTTTPGRKERFIIVEKGASAQSLIIFSQEERITNLIISGQESGLEILLDESFASLFKTIQILHLKDINIDKNWLYQFVNLKRLEIKGCQYKGKEPLDWLKFTVLEELFTPYSKLFENLFVHPTLRTVFNVLTSAIDVITLFIFLQALNSISSKRASVLNQLTSISVGIFTK